MQSPARQREREGSAPGRRSSRPGHCEARKGEDPQSPGRWRRLVAQPAGLATGREEQDRRKTANRRFRAGRGEGRTGEPVGRRRRYWRCGPGRSGSKRRGPLRAFAERFDRVAGRRQLCSGQWVRGGADSGVGPRKTQGAALGHLGHYCASRCWSLLPLPGPPGTVVTPRSPPALEGMQL